MTLAIVIGAAILLSAGYFLRRQGLETLECGSGRIRFGQAQAGAAETAGDNRQKDRT